MRPDMDHCVCVCELRYLLHNFGPDRFLALALGGSVPRIMGIKVKGVVLVLYQHHSFIKTRETGLVS